MCETPTAAGRAAVLRAAGLPARLDAAQDATALPDAPGAREGLHDLIVRARTAGASAER
ncbi:hypothetical protein [Streptomyces decoyicus]|uniref:hypothetical protein n=1 Tax=Streptomyces decoyicus TaxID=249567 RepID=UPI0033A634EF